MKHRFFRNPCLRIAAALLVVAAFSLTTAPPAIALDLNPANYFQLVYEPVTFDKAEVAAGEVFHVILKGRASCTKDLPLPVSEASLTSKVIARPVSGASDLLLNPGYVVNINPIPEKAGETYDINLSVDLVFPAGTPPGSYIIIGQLQEAIITIKVLFSYEQDITEFFAREAVMGTVKCIVPPPPTTTPSTSTQATSPPPTTAPASSPPATAPPAASTPAPETTNHPNQAPPPPAISLTTIVVIASIIAAVILIVLVIIMIRRHRP